MSLGTYTCLKILIKIDNGTLKFKGYPTVCCIGGQFMEEFETGRKFIPTTNIKI
jgi:hypothetical protein